MPEVCLTPRCRDLSKPLGALNPKRLATFQERYRDLKVRAFLCLRVLCHQQGSLGSGRAATVTLAVFLIAHSKALTTLSLSL